MIEWARHRNGSVQTTIGFTRVELWRKDTGKSWSLATYNLRDNAMNFSKGMRTRDLEKAKRRALKFLIATFEDHRACLDSWLSQMRESLK